MKMRKIDGNKLKVDEVISKGVEFHGHLGPFLVAGIKMGRLALEKLGSKGYSDLSVVVETGTRPPVSCLIDGIQISTGCTLGKGNVKVENKGKAKAIFTKDKKSVEIELSSQILKLIDEEDDCEEMAKRVANMPEEQLFKS